MDLTGSFPEGPSGNCYILVVGDYLKKWMETYAVPDQEVTTIAQKLADEFFCSFFVRSRLHFDQGKQSKVISAICQLLQIDKSRTTPYHLQSDGLVERLNCTRTDMLSITVKEHPFEWESPL